MEDKAHIYFKIETEKLKELIGLYHTYSHNDNKNKADFIREPYVKLMFKNFAQVLARKMSGERNYENPTSHKV